MNSNEAFAKLNEWGIKTEHVTVAGEAYTRITIPQGTVTGLKKLRVLDFLKFLGYYILRE